MRVEISWRKSALLGKTIQNQSLSNNLANMSLTPGDSTTFTASQLASSLIMNVAPTLQHNKHTNLTAIKESIHQYDSSTAVVELQD